jgi:hypothetical protein
MTASSRERISIDLQGLKPALLASAQARRLSPSEFIRQALAFGLDRSAPALDDRPEGLRPARVRIGLRLEAEWATALRTAAKAAGLSAGDFVSSLLAGAQPGTASARPVDQAAALTTSCSALTSLGRDLRHLTVLLSQSEVEAARQYRGRLDDVGDQVRAHLRLAAAVLAHLKHLRRSPSVHTDTGREN